MLSCHDSRAAPQIAQSASPVCGTKNFSSVRLYSAPQVHCTIVTIPANMCFGPRNFQSGNCHNRTEPPLRDQSYCANRHVVLSLVGRRCVASGRVDGQRKVRFGSFASILACPQHVRLEGNLGIAVVRFGWSQRLAAEFGLTPVVRARLSASGYAPPSPPSKFDSLLK